MLARGLRRSGGYQVCIRTEAFSSDVDINSSLHKAGHFLFSQEQERHVSAKESLCGVLSSPRVSNTWITMQLHSQGNHIPNNNNIV